MAGLYPWTLCFRITGLGWVPGFSCLVPSRISVFCKAHWPRSLLRPGPLFDNRAGRGISVRQSIRQSLVEPLGEVGLGGGAAQGGVLRAPGRRKIDETGAQGRRFPLVG